MIDINLKNRVIKKRNLFFGKVRDLRLPSEVNDKIFEMSYEMELANCTGDFCKGKALLNEIKTVIKEAIHTP